MRRVSFLAALAVLFAVAAAPQAAAPPADRIFVNGRIWTGDARRPARRPSPSPATASWRWARMPRSGASPARAPHRGPARALRGPRVQRRAPALPASWRRSTSPAPPHVAEIQRRIRAYAAAHPERPWVTGRGWVYGAFPGGMPHERLLDAVVSDRPAFMIGYDGHTAWANSRALAAGRHHARHAGSASTGSSSATRAGEPTGVLKEAAARLVRRLVPAAHGRGALRGAQAAAGPGRVLRPHLRAERELHRRRPAGLRARAGGGRAARCASTPRCPWSRTSPRRTSPATRRCARSTRGPLFKFGAVKGFVDGVVESKHGGHVRAVRGQRRRRASRNWTPEDLDRTVALYDREGFQIFLHAIGDSAIRMALDAYEHAATVNGTSGRRHRVEHIEVPTRADIARFKPLGVIASTQALFANPDQNTLEVYAVTLGPDRASRAMAFRSLDEAGAVQAFGSDSPVFSMEVLRGHLLRGHPHHAGGHARRRMAAPRADQRRRPPCATSPRDAAYASFEEQRKGTLARGDAGRPRRPLRRHRGRARRSAS